MSASLLRLARPKSLAEAVTSRLREDIVEGQFNFGQALSESKIAARYEVSRTPVREAFACLGLEGLVRTEPQQGTFVFTMTREQFALMSETRSILETAALRLAVQRSHAVLVRHWSRLGAAMTAAREEGDAKRYTRADGDFHSALFKLAANPFLAAAGQSFSAKMAAVRNRLGSKPEHIERSYAEHIELLRLIERADTEAAAELLERHIRCKGEDFWPDDQPITGRAGWR